MIKKAIALFALLVSASAFAQVSGNITTQNLNATSAATEGSCVTMDVRDKGAVSVGVQDTYTGALSAQRTTDGSTWETLTASTTFTNKAGTSTATITSGTTGTFQLSGVTGFLKARVCGLAAVTGSAKVTMQSSVSGGSSGGGSSGGATTIADGGDTAQGTTTDAVCATDTGTCTEIALVKKTNANLTILAGSNGQLPTGLGPTTKSASLSTTGATDDPAALGIGGTADAAATAGSTGSINAKLRTITGAIGTAGSGGTNVVTVQGNASGTPIPVTTTFGSTGTDVAVAITRTNDTNAYTAGDVIGTATGSTAAITFTALCPIISKPIMITSAEFRVDAAAIISGETGYTLYLYNVTPPSATGDNGAWDLPSGDRASFLGSISLGTPIDVGSTLYVANDGINKQILCPASGNIFAYLVTVGGYTPTASRVYNVTLHAVGL